MTQIKPLLRESGKRLFSGLLEQLPLTSRRKLLFLRSHGKLPNLKNPSTFSEKVTWRLLYDHNPELKWTCDKLLMKDKVRELDATVTPVDTVWSGTAISQLSSIALPHRWVLKPNHLSGDVYLGEGTPDLEDVAEKTSHWLHMQDRYQQLGEWAYQFARPLYLIEPWIGGNSLTEVPKDYKVFVFHGEPKMIQIHSGRGIDHRQYHVSPEWSPLDVKTSISSEDIPERPVNLDEILRQARSIGGAFDFMRVDFYSVGDTVYFGETTPYPAGGRRRFHPEEFDRVLGSYWNLDFER
ncbi:hypothetical protein CW368_09305 [Actinomycetales bacterium SN12]|nr:hypothetical protein CW368_09305 [Actinomycetales bacterium SN12]